MFGLNESKTITASYEDAVKFVDGMMKTRRMEARKGCSPTW